MLCFGNKAVPVLRRHYDAYNVYESPVGSGVAVPKTFLQGKILIVTVSRERQLKMASHPLRSGFVIQWVNENVRF